MRARVSGTEISFPYNLLDSVVLQSSTNTNAKPRRKFVKILNAHETDKLPESEENLQIQVIN